MHLNCPECHSDIGADGINITKAIAICKECDNLFAFEEELEFDRQRELPANRYEIIPPGIEMLRLSYELEIMIDWRKSGKNWLFFFALFWNAFVWIFVLIFVVVAGELFVLLFLSLFVFTGLYLFYLSLGYLFNTTYLLVNDRGLSVEHKPINFLVQKDQYYERFEIDQFFVRRYVLGTQNDVPVHAYAVDLILKNGETKTLIKQMHSAQHAKFIEQELEHYMGIKDRPVPEEWR